MSEYDDAFDQAIYVLVYDAGSICNLILAGWSCEWIPSIRASSNVRTDHQSLLRNGNIDAFPPACSERNLSKAYETHTNYSNLLNFRKY